jgi:XTP/dITP diphosphohydrolase
MRRRPARSSIDNAPTDPSGVAATPAIATPLNARMLLATRSEGKLRELLPLFERAGLHAVDLRRAAIAQVPAEDDLEQFATFEANALAKARYFARQSGLVTVADDSGLEVAALGGRPGVFSKRYAAAQDLDGRALDDANNARLVTELEASADRRARYVCVAACVADGGREFVCRGETGGVILQAPRGARGFGYDPYFFSTELGRTFGEATLEEKERVSHRGRAFRALLDLLREMNP